MKFALIIWIVFLGFCPFTFAHDGGHGPKISDAGKYGGLVAPVIDSKEAKKGAHAALVYKAELVRSSDMKVRVYVYDASMKRMDISQWPSAEGVLTAKVKGKNQSQKFLLKAENNSFSGLAPKAPALPFSLEIEFKEGNRVLVTAFDNLD